VLVPITPAPPLPSYQWSVSLEALWLERSVGSSIGLGFTAYNPASGVPQQYDTDSLFSDDVQFPLATGLRLQVSRRFNDEMAIDATYWGLQQWSVDRAIFGDPYQQSVLAQSPWLNLPPLLPAGGLDDTLAYIYKSQVHNVEISQRFRLNSDNPYWALNWLWGPRYFFLGEDFTLAGSDSAGDIENLTYKTQNNLVGLQTGLQFVRGWDRFQLETGVKVGLAANIFTQHGIDVASTGAGGIPAGFTPFDISHSGTGVSGIFELSLSARCRLSQSLWLRAGYQVYCVTGLALAPRQLDASFGHGGTVALDGLSLGLESAW
jgi:hypothetical protein